MMQEQIPNGVWPVMLTPFTPGNEVDYESLGKLVDWYIAHGVNGLFAVCQSSEMFYLTLRERMNIARFVKEWAAGRVPVIASGHISDSIDDQAEELNEMARTGVDAVVLITNRFSKKNEPDDIWLQNMERVLERLPKDLTLGFYECPYPYKRIMSPEMLGHCAKTGRFAFLKDTSCDIENIRQKLCAIRGTGLKLFNANSATLYQTLKLGVAGYSGVMANFHPELYVWMVKNWAKEPEKAKRLDSYLSLSSLIERQYYPVNAKYHLMLDGVLNSDHARAQDAAGFTATNRLEIEQFRLLSAEYSSNHPY